MEQPWNCRAALQFGGIRGPPQGHFTVFSLGTDISHPIRNRISGMGPEDGDFWQVILDELGHVTLWPAANPRGQMVKSEAVTRPVTKHLFCIYIFTQR